ncbi:MAG: MBL fold metallo-hydrolase [Chloroflexi bacterium]|nr:MBL fold metallo-hydrolase [Chloroflexota bacterium]
MLTLLGTAGGPQAEYVRTGTSSVLTVEGYNYVVDAGRASVTQYLNAGLKFSALAGMFITHLHADHLADYYNYFLLEGGQANAEDDRLPPVPPSPPGPLTVYGPGSAGGLPPSSDPSVATIAPENPTPGIKELTDRLNEGYAYSYNVFMRGDGTTDVRTIETEIHEIAIPTDVGANYLNRAPENMPPFKIYEDSRVQVSAILVPHGNVFPAFAYRFDTAKGSVVFSGDTSYSENVIRLARGADVLVHEVINLDLIQRFGKNLSPALLSHLQDSHTTTSQVAQVAQSAGVPKLVLTHLIPSNPLLVPDLVWKAMCSIGYDGTVYPGNDMEQISLRD